MTIMLSAAEREMITIPITMTILITDRTNNRVGARLTMNTVCKKPNDEERGIEMKLMNH